MWGYNVKRSHNLDTTIKVFLSFNFLPENYLMGRLFLISQDTNVIHHQASTRQYEILHSDVIQILFIPSTVAERKTRGQGGIDRARLMDGLYFIYKGVICRRQRSTRGGRWEGDTSAVCGLATNQPRAETLASRTLAIWANNYKPWDFWNLYNTY